MSARAAGQAHATKTAPDRDASGGKKSGAKKSGDKTSGGKQSAGKRAVAEPKTSTHWSQRAYRIGRVGVFSLPVLAVLIGLGQFSRARFTANPTAYARYLATGRFTWIEIATTYALGAVGVIAIVSLTLLLAVSRSRWIAIAGGATALAGAVCMLIAVGTLVVRAPRVAGPLLRGRLDEVVINAQTRGSATAALVIVAAALLTIGWLLLGLAVFLTSGLSQGDGGLIGLSGPLVYFGGLFSTALPTIGAFMIGAAGLGIAGAAGRLGPVRGPLTSPARTTARRSPTSAFAFTDDMEGNELQGLDDEQIAAIYNYVEVGGTAETADPSTHGDRQPARSSHGTPTAWSVTRSESGAPEHETAGAATAGAVTAVAEPDVEPDLESEAVGASPATPTSRADKTSARNDKTGGRSNEKGSNAKRPSNDTRINEVPSGEVAA